MPADLRGVWKVTALASWTESLHSSMDGHLQVRLVTAAWIVSALKRESKTEGAGRERGRAQSTSSK